LQANGLVQREHAASLLGYHRTASQQGTSHGSLEENEQETKDSQQRNSDCAGRLLTTGLPSPRSDSPTRDFYVMQWLHETIWQPLVEDVGAIVSLFMLTRAESSSAASRGRRHRTPVREGHRLVGALPRARAAWDSAALAGEVRQGR
jgi:hypothetical protein